MRASYSKFYSTNSSGLVSNRLSRDILIVDREIPENLDAVMSTRLNR